MPVTGNLTALCMAAQNSAGLPGWAWALIILGVLALFALIWYLVSRDGPSAQPTAAPAPAGEPAAAPISSRAEPAIGDADLPPDNLTRIEGIGPRISQVLGDAGICTFARLSQTEVSAINDILEAADPRLLRLADPATWPEQARLAAIGDVGGLNDLQRELKGGRRA